MIGMGGPKNDMFQTNKKIIGRKITYDSNPHYFSEKGFDSRDDPHAFRIIDGAFMNTNASSLAVPPDQSSLQPLLRKKRDPTTMTKKRDLTMMRGNKRTKINK